MTTSPIPTPIRVVKLGGSLLDLPDLPARFDRYRQLAGDRRLLLVNGGGETADVVRRFDQHFNLGPHQGHWLAIRAMQFNAHCLAGVLREVQLSADFAGCQAAWRAGKAAIIDPLAWLEEEDRQGVAIPHRWSFTSDSIAAHVAVRVGADVLTLLKSTDAGLSISLLQAAENGLVDADFPQSSRTIPRIEWVNLRADRLTAQCMLDKA